MGLSNKFILKSVGNEHMILPISGGNMDFSKVYNINETGVFIFQQLQFGKTEEEIIIKMKEEYDTKEEILQKDVKEFIEELKIRGIYE